MNPNLVGPDLPGHLFPQNEFYKLVEYIWYIYIYIYIIYSKIQADLIIYYTVSKTANQPSEADIGYLGQ